MVIDFHSHILPGVDDGSRNMDITVEMLRESENQGVATLVATPHFYAHKEAIDTFIQKRDRAYAEVMKHLDSITEKLPNIICGAEVAFFEGISKAEQIERLTIQKTNLLLIEMPFESWNDSIIREIHTLIHKRGITPIIAHVERFYGFKGNAERIEQLMEWPLYLQINGEVILDFWHRRKFITLLKKNQVHLLGSDCHGMHRRPPNLKEARAVIASKAGEDVLSRIDTLGKSLIVD